jgi:hypothetical protein
MKLGNAIGVSLVVFGVVAAPVFAANEKMLEHEDKVLEGAKTTLSQAISTAETEVGGKALSARLESRHKKDFYDVRVVKGDQLTDVHVGIDDGKILSTHPMLHGHMTKSKAAMPEKAEQSGSKS